MEEKKWELVKGFLTIGVVSLTMQKRGWSEEETLRRFLNSQVYDCLQNEETDAWCFSAYQLARFFDNELEGRRIWPDI